MQDKPKAIQQRPGYTEGIVEAAQRILNADTKEKYRVIAALAVFDALRAKAWDDEEADQALMEFAEQMKNETAEKIVAEVKFCKIERKALDAAVKQEQQDATALLAELETYYSSVPLNNRYLRMADSTVKVINQIPDPAEREKYFQTFGKLFAKSSERDLASYGRKLAADDSGPASPLVGQPMELAGTNELGGPFDWASYRGKVVVVDFWTTWCGPCRREMPKLAVLRSALADQPFDVVGVSLDEDLEALAEYLEENKLPWTTLSGEPAHAAGQKYGIRAFPTMALVDKQGTVVAVAHGIGELEPRIRELLAQ